MHNNYYYLFFFPSQRWHKMTKPTELTMSDTNDLTQQSSQTGSMDEASVWHHFLFPVQWSLNLWQNNYSSITFLFFIFLLEKLRQIETDYTHVHLFFFDFFLYIPLLYQVIWGGCSLSSVEKAISVTISIKLEIIQAVDRPLKRPT